MNPSSLREIGEALYGEEWQSDLARAVGVTSRTVRRWLAGDRGTPDWLDNALLRLCADRLPELRDEEAQLRFRAARLQELAKAG